MMSATYFRAEQFISILTSKPHAMFHYFQVFRVSQLRNQSTASLFNDFSKLQVRFAIPVVLLPTPPEDDAATLASRKDVSCFTVTVRGPEIHLTNWLLRTLYQQNLALKRMVRCVKSNDM